MEHPELKLNGVVEAAISKVMFDDQWLSDMAKDPNIEQNTPAEVFQALESFVTEGLARIKPVAGPIREMYNYDTELVDPLLCYAITCIINIPGLDKAILGAALEDNYYLKEFGPEHIGDIPFQYIWDKLMWAGEGYKIMNGSNEA